MTVFQWLDTIDNDTRFQYQELEEIFPWCQSIMAAMIPIFSPHRAEIPPQTLELMEILRLSIFTTNKAETKICLPENNMAILVKNNQILASYELNSSQNLADWLQSFSPWDSQNQLWILDLRDFSFAFCLPFLENIDIRFSLKLSINQKNLEIFLKEWLRNQIILHCNQLQIFFENQIRSSDFFVYCTKNILSSQLKQKQIEKKTFATMKKRAKESGLLLHELRIEWVEEKEVKLEKPKPFRETKMPNFSAIENAVESLEQKRLQLSLPSDQTLEYRRASKEMRAKIDEKSITRKESKLDEEKELRIRETFSQSIDPIQPELQQRSIPKEIAPLSITMKIEKKRLERPSKTKEKGETPHRDRAAVIEKKRYDQIMDITLDEK